MGVTLTGYLEVPDADIALVEAHLPDHIALTRAESGCVSFDVRPDPANRNRYLVNEVFRDRAAFDLHQKRVKSSEWGKVTAHLARSYEICDEISE